MQCACVKLIRMREVSLVAFSARQVRSRTTAIAVTKVMAHEGTDDISATSPTPQEPFSEETIRAIADCVVKQLRSSTQDGDTSPELLSPSQALLFPRGLVVVSFLWR